MPIIVTYLNPNMRPDIIEGESWARIDQDSPRLGTINLKAIGDDHRIIVNKSAVAKVEEFPAETWEKMKQEQRDFEDAQNKQRADDEAKKKADAAAALLAHLEAKTLKSRVRRMFGKKP